MVEPSSVAIASSKVAVERVLKFVRSFAAKNDRALESERADLALQWGAEIQRALPEVFAYLAARVDDL